MFASHARHQQLTRAFSCQVEVPSEGDEASDAVAIDGKLLSLRKQSGTLRVVSSRALRRGDTVICDFDAGDAGFCLHSFVTSTAWCNTAAHHVLHTRLPAPTMYRLARRSSRFLRCRRAYG